jgi:hypothetical protein
MSLFRHMLTVMLGRKRFGRDSLVHGLSNTSSRDVNWTMLMDTNLWFVALSRTCSLNMHVNGFGHIPSCRSHDAAFSWSSLLDLGYHCCHQPGVFLPWIASNDGTRQMMEDKSSTPAESSVPSWHQLCSLRVDGAAIDGKETFRVHPTNRQLASTCLSGVIGHCICRQDG